MGMAVVQIVLKIYCIFMFFCITEAFEDSSSQSSGEPPVLHFVLEPNKQVRGNGTKLDIYCHGNSHKTLIYIWKSVNLELVQAPPNYKLYNGENASEVYKKYSEETIWRPSTWISWRDTVVGLPAFSEYCIGILADQDYELQLKVLSINFWKVLQTTIGVALFFSAPSLSRNAVFYYTSGVSLGVVASMLVLLFVITRLIPKKSAAYAMLGFGVSFIFYFLQVFYHHLPTIISDYMHILLAYIFFAAFVSFIVCYRLGPVENVRTFNIIQWSMQVISVLLIFFSSEYKEASTAIIMAIITLYFIPSKWISKARQIWYRYFPPKVTLLTETEYIDQGYRETKQALENLRDFCTSPECKAWSTVKNLKDPKRFAQFIEGGSHLTDAEILMYDTDIIDTEALGELADDVSEPEDNFTFSNQIGNGTAVCDS